MFARIVGIQTSGGVVRRPTIRRRERAVRRPPSLIVLFLLLAARDRRRVHTDALALARDVLELDAAIDQREQRVVAADADVHAGLERRAALADDDAARADELAVAD